MHIITARTSNVRRLEDHQIIFGLVSLIQTKGKSMSRSRFNQKPRPTCHAPSPMIKEAKRKLRLGNKLPTEVISMTVHDMLMSRVA